jgi:hypothetical protein
MTEQEKSLVKENSVVQINENGQEGWIGCFLQVSEVKTWGIMGWVQIPMGGSAYLRPTWNQIDYIGNAVLVPQKHNQ